MDFDSTTTKEKDHNIDDAVDDIERLVVSFLASRVRGAVKEVLLEQEAQSNVRVDSKECNSNVTAKDEARLTSFVGAVNDRFLRHSTVIAKNDNRLTNLQI